MAPNATPPPLAWLHHARAFAHIGEYVQVICALVPNTPMAPLTKNIVTLHHLHLLAKVDLPPFVNDFIQRWILFWIKRHLFLFWHVFHIFHLVILRVWCMNFCKIVLSLMILLVALIYFLKYVNTLLVVMFFHQYHTCLLHYDYWLTKTSQRCLTRCDWKGDLSVSCSQTSYLIHRNICKTFYSTVV